MFGSHPGTMEYKASLLASHGFVSLALAYFGVPGLPNLYLSSIGDWTIRLEYFEYAINYLLNTEKVDKSCGVGVMVLSFTGFIGLAIATFLPNVRCLISQNGATHVTYLTLKYKDLTLETQDWEIKGIDYSDGDIVEGRDMCRYFDTSFSMTAPAPEDLDIKFYEKKDVAYMFIASLSDANTPSEHYVNRSHKLLRLAKHPNYEMLRYPGAGHLLEPPYITHNSMTQVKGFSGSGNVFVWGGETVAHCKAQEDAWKKEITFLHKNLSRRARL